MTVRSMTGYGRADGAAEGLSWYLEIKSVNGRGLDVRCRLPALLDAFEADLRERIGQRLERGNVTVSVTFAAGNDATAMALNTDVLDQYIAAALDLVRRHGLNMPTAAEFLGLRGVADFASTSLDEDAQGRLREAVQGSVDKAVDAVLTLRQAEGERMASAVGQLLDRIERLVGEAEARAEAQPALVQARITESLNRLLADKSGIDPDRLAQEIALLASKADVREELDRLTAHVAAARNLLKTSGAVGRAFEFLSQEFVRETNTLCSKSTDSDLTRIGLDLKAVIEQVREQIKNLE